MLNFHLECFKRWIDAQTVAGPVRTFAAATINCLFFILLNLPRGKMNYDLADILCIASATAKAYLTMTRSIPPAPTSPYLMHSLPTLSMQLGRGRHRRLTKDDT